MAVTLFSFLQDSHFQGQMEVFNLGLWSTSQQWRPKNPSDFKAVLDEVRFQTLALLGQSEGIQPSLQCPLFTRPQKKSGKEPAVGEP